MDVNDLAPDKTDERQHVTFHIRPVYAPTSQLQVLATSDKFLLISEGNNDFIIMRADQTGQFDSLRQLPKEMVDGWGWHFSFMDDSALCFVHAIHNSRHFTVIRSSDNFYSAPLERKSYRIQGLITRSCSGWSPQSVSLSQNQIFISLHRLHFESDARAVELWHFEVPDWDSTDDSVELERYAVAEKAQNVCNAIVNGPLVAAKIFIGGEGFSITSWETLIFNSSTKASYRVRGQNSRSPQHCFEPINNGFLCWESDRSSIRQSAVFKSGNDFEQVHYEAKMPIHAAETDSAIHKFVKSKDRFFFEAKNALFMGFLPGADNSLEEIAVAAVWQGLSENAQTELLASRQWTNRKILLSAMHDIEKGKEKQINPPLDGPVNYKSGCKRRPNSNDDTIAVKRSVV